MTVVKGTKNLFDLEETALVLSEIDGVSALEIDLDENQTLVVLAQNRFEEAASAENLLQDQVVRRRQVVEVVLGGGDLGRARDLVSHPCLCVPPVYVLFSFGSSLSNHFLHEADGGRICARLCVAGMDSETYL